MNSFDLCGIVNETRILQGKKVIRHNDLLNRIKSRIPGVEIKQIKHKQNNQSLCAAVLNKKQKDDIISAETGCSLMYGERENGALSAIEQVLGIKLERQYFVCGFRIDGYCKDTNTAYEIDEPQHYINGKLSDECVSRQLKIELKLKCKFVRIKV